MNIGILAQPDSYYARDLQRAARERNHQVHLLSFADLASLVSPPQEISSPHGSSSGDTRFHARQAVDATGQRFEELPRPFDLTTLDLLLVRTMPPGTLEQVVFRMNLLGLLAERGVRVVNPPKSLECAVDKYLTTVRLVAAGLPSPPTWTCETCSAALEAFEQSGGDVVVKPLFGSEGRGIVRVSDRDLADRTFRTLERLGAVLYLQRFIPHGGCDLRIMVLRGRVLGAMQRSNPTDFRTNVSRKGTSSVVQATDRQCEWAIRAAQAVGAEIAGVDLLRDQHTGEEYVIEVNAVPGWKAFRATTGIDVAGRLLDELQRGM